MLETSIPVPGGHNSMWGIRCKCPDRRLFVVAYSGIGIKGTHRRPYRTQRFSSHTAYKEGLWTKIPQAYRDEHRPVYELQTRLLLEHIPTFPA